MIGIRGCLLWSCWTVWLFLDRIFRFSDALFLWFFNNVLLLRSRCIWKIFFLFFLSVCDHFGADSVDHVFFEMSAVAVEAIDIALVGLEMSLLAIFALVIELVFSSLVFVESVRWVLEYVLTISSHKLHLIESAIIMELRSLWQSDITFIYKIG